MTLKQTKGRILGQASKATLGANFGTIERDGLRVAGPALISR